MKEIASQNVLNKLLITMDNVRTINVMIKVARLVQEKMTFDFQEISS